MRPWTPLTIVSFPLELGASAFRTDTNRRQSGSGLMVRMRCRSCGLDREVEWAGRAHRRPRCGSADVCVSLAIKELPAELFGRLRQSIADDNRRDIRGDD